jgi:hypothetical protein
MKKHEIAYLAIRILVIYSFIQGLLNISTVIQFSIVNVIQNEFEPRLKVYFPLIEQTIKILFGITLLFIVNVHL